jgi:hypothetical protein
MKTVLNLYSRSCAVGEHGSAATLSFVQPVFGRVGVPDLMVPKVVRVASTGRFIAVVK